MDLNKIASSIVNDLFAGNLIPQSNRSLISLEQIEDEVAMERCSVIQEMYLKNLLSKDDLRVTINCIEVDCADMNGCETCKSDKYLDIPARNQKHFEIPILMEGIGDAALSYVGSTDRVRSYDIYYNWEDSTYHQYSRSGSYKPYVYINRTPNKNNKYDGWIYNAPYVKYISVTGIFKDLRQLTEYNCCHDVDFLDYGTITNDVRNRILNKKVQLYRTASPIPSQVV